MNLRLVIAVMCVPMPPCFFGLPLRQMMLPLRGPTPVSSQILAIIILFQIKAAEDNRRTPRGKHFFHGFLNLCQEPRFRRNQVNKERGPDASGAGAEVVCGAGPVTAKSLESGEASPSNLTSRTILETAFGSRGFPRRGTRRCLADKSNQRKKRRPVVALQSAAGAFSEFRALFRALNP